jgi:hypothetical protein
LFEVSLIAYCFQEGKGRHHPPSITSEELDNLVGDCPLNSAVSLFDLFASHPPMPQLGIASERQDLFR